MNPQEIFIEVEPIRGNQWRVRVTPVGRHHGQEARVPAADRPALAAFPHWNAVLNAMAPTSAYQLSGQDLRTLGDGIWQGLIGGSSLATYLRDHLAALHAEGRPVRFALKVRETEDAGLSALPVELARACGPEWGDRFVWKRNDVPAIRVLSQLEALPVRFEAGARMIIATAHDPKNPVPGVDELATHGAAIRALAERSGFTVEHVPEASPDALAVALSRGCDLLYVVAHGEADPDDFGVLALSGSLLPGTQLRQMLDDTRATARPCRAVVLCACSSAAQRPGERIETTGMAQVLAEHVVPAAIGFRAPIGVTWAMTFMERLFGSLADHRDLETAFTRARAAFPDSDPQWPLAAYYGRPLKLAAPADPQHAPAVPGHTIRSVLPDPPRRYFTAREAQVAQLLDLSTRPGVALIQAIEGQGGIGKSELARVVAHRVASTRPVVWLDRPDRAPRRALEVMLAAVTEGPPADTGELSDAVVAEHVRMRLRGHAGLLVLDDVSDANALALLLPGGDWRTLITTRVDQLVPGAERLELDHLPPADARVLFCRVAFGDDVAPEEERAAVDALVGQLGGLPLALELAGASVARGTTVEAYLGALGATHGPAWADQARIRATLAQTLHDVDDDERAVFEALGVVPACGADPKTLAVMLDWPEGRTARGLDRLSRYRAARLAAETGRFTLHPLLRDEARARVEARPADWHALHAGLATSLRVQVEFAAAPLRVNPALALSRWQPLRELVDSLDLAPWLKGTTGAEDVILLLAYSAADFRDRELGVAERRAAHRKAVDLARRSVASDEVSRTAGPALSTLCNRLGDACVALGDGKAALEAYNEGLDIARRLVAQDPDSAQALRDLSVSLERLGDLFLRAGDGKAALDAYNEGLDIDRRLVAQDPDSAEALRDLSVSLDKLGDLFLRAGEGKAALEAYNEGLDIRRKLVAQDPDSAQALRDLSVSLERLGDLFLRAGDGKAALDAYNEAVQHRQQVVAVDPSAAQLRRELAVALFLRGRAEAGVGRNEEALVTVEQAVESARALNRDYPAEADFRRVLGALLTGLAELLESAGDAARAAGLRAEAAALGGQSPR
ncbi:CHAT domain-containing protein [Myxococcota bacterium]|nr:CHAT domain-containing protein [Myxococcota bacterium]